MTSPPTVPQTFMDDQAVIERILTHVQNGTTDLGNEVWREPVENYRSEARFRSEIELLRRLPVPFCPSAALRAPGAYVARTAAGVPILAVRGQDGIVRAFRNTCRHRGSEVAQGTGCVKAFVCPYHGWTYALDGRLQRVHQKEGFPGLDQTAHGLVPVRAEERSGIVFITQDVPEELTQGTAAARGTSEAGEGLGDLIPPGHDVIDTHDNEADFNWKVSIEGSIEGYHIRFGHPNSFYPYGYDNLNVVEHCGRNSRITFPFKRIEKLAKVPPAERKIEGRVTTVYHLFPNALVTILSHHTILVVLEPIAPGRTRNIAYSLAHTGGDPVAAETAKRDAAFVTESGAPEDRALAESVQRSLQSEANDHLTFGHFESAIVHFHRNLRAALAKR